MALEFAPLYWVYHDGWNYTQTKTLLDVDKEGNLIRIDKSKTFYQMGHCHLFLMDVNPEGKGSSGQAYWGEQTYQFHLKDEWGPNSDVPGQAQTIKLIGKPMWYFYIEEYWRRFYAQPWETNDPKFKNGIHDGKVGIKYDASKPEHSLGPFREGGEFYFFDTVVNRTMPVEYWREETKQTRDFFLKQKRKGEETSGGQTWSFPIKDRFFRWVEDVHFAAMAVGQYFSVTHRKPSLIDTPYNYGYDYQGMNAKRIKTDKYVKYICDGDEWQGRNNAVVESHERVTLDENGQIELDDTVDWEGSPKFNPNSEENPYHQSRFGERGWTGWYEEGEIVQYKGKWYRREWAPFGYDKGNFNPEAHPCWTTTKRRHFPNPPPNLCDGADFESSNSESSSESWESPEAERMSKLHWEYFLYYGRVRHYDWEGNPIRREGIEDWEDRIERYKEENAISDEKLSLEDERDCFAQYLDELGNEFFSKWTDKISPTTGRVEPCYPQGYPPLTYVTFSDFRKTWRQLTEEELEERNFYGDKPRRNNVPFPDPLHSAFYPRSRPLDSSDTPQPPLTPEEQALDESEHFPISSPYDPYRGGEVDPIAEWKKYFTKRETFTIPDDTHVEGDCNIESWKSAPYKPLPHPREQSYSAEDGARRQFPDDWFVSPIIEYQRVTHLDYERLPAYQAEEAYVSEHWEDREDQGNWGEGFDATIQIPYRKSGAVQSPLSEAGGVVQPPGVYCHDVVKDQDKLRYHLERLSSFAQLRKWDFPGYVDFIRSFQALRPDYVEDFDDPVATEEMLDSKPEGSEQTWRELLTAHFEQSQFYNAPVTRRDDENSYAANGVWRAQTTHLLVESDKVGEDGQPELAQWTNPYPNRTDGQWFEECLGAIVKAKVKLVLEDALGHRFIQWVDAYAMDNNSQTLQGSDHDAKGATNND